MNYMINFTEISNRLDEVLAENKLVYSFRTDRYPIALIISPDASPDAQLALYEVSDENSTTSSDARLIFTFPVGGIGVKIQGRLVMSDALMSKVKGLAKKMHIAYLEAYFANLMTLPAGSSSSTAEESQSDLNNFDSFFDNAEGETCG